MTDEQKQWLEDNAAFKVWRPQYVVSTYHWVDTGYVFPDGRYVAEGEHHGWAWPVRLMSSGDTLHVLPKDALKVGRAVMAA